MSTEKTSESLKLAQERTILASERTILAFLRTVAIFAGLYVLVKKNSFS